MVLLNSSLIWTASAAEISKHAKTLNTCQIYIRLLLLSHQDVTALWCSMKVCAQSQRELTYNSTFKRTKYVFIYLFNYYRLKRSWSISDFAKFTGETKNCLVDVHFEN